jgi:hypothetical protein
MKSSIRGNATINAAKNGIAALKLIKKEGPEAEEESAGPAPPDHSPPPSPTPEEDEDHNHTAPEPEHPPQDEPPPHPEDDPPPDEPLVDGRGLTVQLRLGEPSELAPDKYLSGHLHALVFFNHGKDDHLSLVKRLDLEDVSSNVVLLQLHEDAELGNDTVATIELYKEHAVKDTNVFMGQVHISGSMFDTANGEGPQDYVLNLTAKEDRGVGFNMHAQGSLHLEVDVRKWSNWTSIPCVCCLELLSVKGLTEYSNGHYAIIAVNDGGGKLDSVGKRETPEGYKEVFNLDWSKESADDDVEQTVFRVQLWGTDEDKTTQIFLGEVIVTGAELQGLYKAQPVVFNKQMAKPLKIDISANDIDHNKHVGGEVSMRVRIRAKTADKKDDVFEDIEVEEKEEAEEVEEGVEEVKAVEETAVEEEPEDVVTTETEADKTSLPSLAAQGTGEIDQLNGTAKTPNANGSSKMPSYSPTSEEKKSGATAKNGVAAKNGIAIAMGGSPCKAGSPANDVFVGEASEAIQAAKNANYMRELRDIYREHDPQNEGELDTLVVQYADHLNLLLDGVRVKYDVKDPYKKQEDIIKKQNEEIENLKAGRLELKEQMDALLQASANKKACWFC